MRRKATAGPSTSLRFAQDDRWFGQDDRWLAGFAAPLRGFGLICDSGPRVTLRFTLGYYPSLPTGESA
jgi:hypothetical protein